MGYILVINSGETYMIRFTAIMIDETRTEFSVWQLADSRAEARQILAEYYPESRLISIRTPEEIAYDEQDRYDRINLDEWDWFS